MIENTIKLTKTQLIVGVVVLAVILVFAFSGKPSAEQGQNLQESKSEALQMQDNSSYRNQLVDELMGENEHPLETNEVSLRFMVHDFFDNLIKEGYLKNTDFDKQQSKMTLYLDSDVLTDRRIETWITGLGFQVAGGLENTNEDFAIAADTDPDTGDVIEFAVNNIVVKKADINGYPAWGGNLALESTKGTDGHAKVLDLVIGGKIFAHFETGGVFAELKRLGLIGGMTVDGKIIFERKLKK